MATTSRERVVAGLSLIVMGLGLYWLHRVEGIGDAGIFLFIGGLFLAAYLYKRVYGFLVPAGILLGLGAGRIGEDSIFDWGSPQLLGLGFGFVFIFLVALLYQRRTHWWPLIPGTALIFLGVRERDRVFQYLSDNWPLLFVILGGLILLSALGGSRRARGGKADG